MEDFPLDIFTVMRGKQYHDLISATGQVEINGTEVNFLDAAALVQLKEGSQREKDQIDITALKRIKLENDQCCRAPKQSATVTDRRYKS